MAQRIWFWRDWPPHKQKRFFSLAVWGWLAVLFISFGPQYFFTVNAEKKIEQQRALYQQVVPLVSQIKSLRARKNGAVDGTLHDAVLEMTEKAGIGWPSLSLSEEPFEYTEPGMRVNLEKITLVQLTGFLQQVRTSPGVSVLQFSMKKDPEQSVLADVELLLVR